MAARGSEWANQASLNALLKYRPQREGIADLLRQARERFTGSVHAGISEGHLQEQAAQRAIEPTKGIFSSSRTEGERSRALMAGALAQLPAGSPFAIAAANEQAAGGERLAGAEAHALSDLEQRRVAGAELPAFSRQAAQVQLVKDLQQLQAKSRSIDSAEGADTQAEVDAQRKEAHKDALTERGQNLTAEASREGNRTSERNTAAHNKQAERDAEIAHGGKGKDGLFKPEVQAKAAGLVGQIRQLAGEAGGSRAERVQALTEGRPSQKLKKGEVIEGKTVPADTTIPGFKGFKPDVLMSAALDWAEHGFVTSSTQHRLRSKGYNPHALDIPLSPPPAKGLHSPAHMGR